MDFQVLGNLPNLSHTEVNFLMEAGGNPVHKKFLTRMGCVMGLVQFTRKCFAVGKEMTEKSLDFQNPRDAFCVFW